MRTQGCLSKVQSFIRSFTPTNRVLLLCFVAFMVGCKPANEEIKKVKRVESELNVPSMSAEQKKSADSRLDWNIETLVDAYDKVGSRNKKWDTQAHDALKLFAQVRSYGTDIHGFPGVLSAHLARAIELGCDDPMINYLHTCYVRDFSNLSQEEVSQAYTKAADALSNSKYPPIRKFYAHLNAASQLKNIRPSPSSLQTYIDGAADNLYATLEHSDVPIGEVDDAGYEFLTIIENWSEKKTLYDRMEELLMKNWSKSGVTYAIRGQFYIDYAWDGRSRKMANKVTKEQWQLFAERLTKTQEILTTGMEIDPKEGRLPSLMIKVVSGQGQGLDVMQQWWAKSMESNTNNFQACQNLLNFLLPRWYGSREKMIEFGRSCFKSDKYGGTVPLVLAEAHDMYNRFDGAPDGSYWTKPDVWPDIRDAYEKFFKLNPNARGWHHNYARYAYWCEQWDTVLQQVKLMDEDVNYNYFGGRAEFEKMVKLAESHTSQPKQ